MLLALSLVVASAVLAQQEKWNELRQQAEKLRQEQKYAEATRIAEQALDVADHVNKALEGYMRWLQGQDGSAPHIKAECT